MVTIKIPCPHEAIKSSYDTAMLDHHPLSRAELKELLEIASGTSDWRVANQIQIRLVQAIPGNLCPRQGRGPVAQKATRLESLYVKARTNNRAGLLGLIDEFAEILGISK